MIRGSASRHHRPKEFAGQGVEVGRAAHADLTTLSPAAIFSKASSIDLTLLPDSIHPIDPTSLLLDLSLSTGQHLVQHHRRQPQAEQLCSSIAAKRRGIYFFLPFFFFFLFFLPPAPDAPLTAES
jgi:hypothetical protein